MSSKKITTIHLEQWGVGDRLNEFVLRHLFLHNLGVPLGISIAHSSVDGTMFPSIILYSPTEYRLVEALKFLLSLFEFESIKYIENLVKPRSYQYEAFYYAFGMYRSYKCELFHSQLVAGEVMVHFAYPSLSPIANHNAVPAPLLVHKYDIPKSELANMVKIKGTNIRTLNRQGIAIKAEDYSDNYVKRFFQIRAMEENHKLRLCAKKGPFHHVHIGLENAKYVADNSEKFSRMNAISDKL